MTPSPSALCGRVQCGLCELGMTPCQRIKDHDGHCNVASEEAGQMTTGIERVVERFLARK